MLPGNAPIRKADRKETKAEDWKMFEYQVFGVVLGIVCLALLMAIKGGDAK